MTESLHALVIDDDDDDLFLASQALEQSGRFGRVSTAGGGRSGLACLGQAEPPPQALEPVPDVVFLDLSMPGMTGLAVLEHLAENPNVPPVVVLTSSSNPQDRSMSLKFPFVRGFVEKPLNAERAAALASELG